MLKHQKLIEKMTLEEKIALLNSVSKNATAKQSRAGAPSAVFSGKECGALAPEVNGEAAAPTTCFPEPFTVARSWNLELSSKVAYCMGKEAAALGVSVLCAPDANLMSHPYDEKNYKRFSEDSYLAGKMTAAYVRGIQENDVAACLEAPELGGFYVSGSQDAWVDERALREIYLQPFEMAVKEGGVKCIRTSEKRVNGEALSSSKHIMRGIMRGEWGYEGVTVSSGKSADNAVVRLANGNDLTLGVSNLSAITAELVRAYRKYELYQKGLADGSIRKADYEAALDSGTVLEPETLDAAADRVLDLVLTTKKTPSDDRDAVYSAYPFRHKVVFNEKAHANVALEAAAESVVLLKNIANTLPLGQNTAVAFVGEMIKRPFSQGNSVDKISATGGESTVTSVGKTKLNVVGCAQGYGSGESEQTQRELMGEACALAAKAEVVVIYAGIDESNRAQYSQESGIRQLPAAQIALIQSIRAMGKRVVVVLVGSAAVDMSWDSMCDAVLLAGISGQAGSKAILKVLSGEIAPSGRLAETIPAFKPIHKAALEDGAVEFRDSVFFGYRFYEKTGAEVKYPFGYGLSYTDFRYYDIRLENNGVSFTVENIGAFDGAEVAQMYVAKEGSALPRAQKELKGFTKVFLKMGESARVTIPFDSKTFRFYNVKTRRFEIESGSYKIIIGSNAQNVRLEQTVDINGSSAEGVYKKDELASYYNGAIGAVDSAEFARLYNRSVRNGNFYKLKKKKKSPVKLLGFIPILVAAIIDALVVLSMLVPIIFKNLYYILAAEEKFLVVAGAGLLTAAAIVFCVIFCKRVNKKARIKAGDVALSQWNAELYNADLEYPEDWKNIEIKIDEASGQDGETLDDEMDDIVRDRKNALYVSLDTVCREFCQYSKLRGINVSVADARQIFSAISASRMIFVKNADIGAAKAAFKLLGEFLQMKCYAATITSNINSLESLLMPSSTSELLSAVLDPKANSKAFYMSVLCNVEPERMRSYFESFIPFISNPKKKCELKLGANLVEVADGDEYATVALTPNMWFAAILSLGSSFAQIDKEIADNSICLSTEIGISVDSAPMSAEAAQKSVNTYYATVLEWSHRVDNVKEELYLDENSWHAIDEIESYLASRGEFGVGNKLINRTERFAAVYLAMGGEDDCLDNCVASVILPSALKLDIRALNYDDRKLSDVVDEALDTHGNKKTRAALREFGIA